MKKMKKNLIPAIEYLLQNPTISMTKVGQLFNVDRHAIAKYKNTYQLYKYENQSDKNDEFVYYFSDAELEFIYFYLNNPNVGYEKLAAQYPEAPERRALYHWLDILGKEKTVGGAIKYHYDRTRFKQILTEEDAYWLGFITADGCIIEGKWLQLQLAAIDYEHLVKFGRYMGLAEEEINEIIKDGYGGAYTRDNPIVNIKICSLEIIANLQDKGVTARKSGSEIPYICSTPELELAYIRGLIDGDGYIRSTQYGMGIVGSQDICSYIQQYITNYICDISTNHIHKHRIIYKLELAGRLQTTKILQALYNNATIYLDRKYQLYLQKYT